MKVEGAPPAPPPPTSAAPLGIGLDVQVDMPEKLYVRGGGLESEWHGNIEVTGTADDPLVVGSIEFRRGSPTASRSTGARSPSAVRSRRSRSSISRRVPRPRAASRALSRSPGRRPSRSSSCRAIPRRGADTTASAGKYICDNVFLEAQQGVTPGSARAKIEIELTPGLSAETQVGQQGQSGFSLNWTYDY